MVSEIFHQNKFVTAEADIDDSVSLKSCRSPIGGARGRLAERLKNVASRVSPSSDLPGMSGKINHDRVSYVENVLKCWCHLSFAALFTCVCFFFGGTQVRGLPGTYIVNQHATDVSSSKPRTLITFDQGGFWRPIPATSVHHVNSEDDDDKNLVNCPDKKVHSHREVKWG